jgi:adenosylhomocysteine nucleosidase
MVFTASNKMIAVFVALQYELNSFLGNVLVESKSTKKGCTLIIGGYAQKDILLVRTGVGKELAQSAASFVLENYPISTIINIGFGGALNHDLEIGDLILCHKIQFADTSLSESSYCSNRNLIDSAQRAMSGKDVVILTGNCVTVMALLAGPDEKAALVNISQADVVDMESYWIAEIAAENDLKFLAVRAISDTSTERLPPFDRFMNSGAKWQAKEAVFHFISKPKDIAKLPQIYMHSAKAGRSLNLLFRSLIPNIDETEIRKHKVHD